ncbi:MAG TPA: MFS transporter [Streptosporangiaceae bacterium]
MSQVRSEERASAPGNPYLEILRINGALAFSAAGFVGRICMAMYGLGTVLLISAATGRYGLAGLVAGAGAVGYAITAPLAARLADRFGQHRVLRPLAASFAISTAAFAACAQLRAPAWALLLTGVLAGASMPSVGAMVRTRWSALLADPARLHTAFSLESVADEVIFVIGPVLVTLLATQVYPPAGVSTAMVLCVTGSLLLAAQRRSEPPVRPAPPRPAAWPRGRPTVPGRGLVTLAPVYLFIGSMFAGIDLSTVAFAQQQGHKPLAGVVLAIYALGSAAGGLWYGTRHWRAPLERRFVITLGCTAAGVATFAVQPGLASLAAVIFCCGVVISPTLIAGYGLVERQAVAGRRTEGMTWLSSSISVGAAAGAAVTGHIVDAAGPHWGYAFAAGSGAAATLTCLLGFGRLRAGAAAPPALSAQ